MMRSVSKFIDEIENCGLKVSFQLEKYLHPLRPDFRNDDYSLIEAVNDRKTPVVNISARVLLFYCLESFESRLTRVQPRKMFAML